MFFKEILSFMVAPIVFIFGSIFGTPNTSIYVAPEPTLSTTTPPTTVSKTTQKPEATTTQVVKKEPTKPEVKSVIKTATTTTVKPVPTEIKNIEIIPDFELINEFARKSIVNILCSTKGGELSPVSGTGVVVKPDGLILTNAHLGQYLLLKDFQEKDFVECVIRTGSPAYPKYNVELVYISPTWVANNKALLKEQNPKGTGENDFAFLRITRMIDGSNLPTEFSYIKMNPREFIGKEEPVLLASYPAGFLGGLSILQNLNIVSSITNIQDVFTFKENSIDLISVPGTVVSQKGSSGGAVVDMFATLIGMISTSSDSPTTKERDLRAITISYINRDLQTELGVTLDQFVNQNSAEFAKKFQEINAPLLTKLIVDELNK